MAEDSSPEKHTQMRFVDPHPQPPPQSAEQLADVKKNSTPRYVASGFLESSKSERTSRPSHAIGNAPRSGIRPCETPLILNFPRAASQSAASLTVWYVPEAPSSYAAPGKGIESLVYAQVHAGYTESL